MPFCKKCGAEVTEGVKFCTRCGSPIRATAANWRPSEMIIVTTPSIPSFRVTRILGVVTGLTARTRGVGGRFVAGIQSALGGEVSAFTSEIEKARIEAIDRMTAQAQVLGANAIIGLDIETSDVFQGTILLSATGTAVTVESE